ncbi:MAG: flagellar protein FliS [Parasphingorhabdus sp.]|nr:flagellar protein FliS [Parasphingorhabdus sp.]
MTQHLAARSRYATTSSEAKVLSANPHGLVTILFERLEELLDEMVAAQQAGREQMVADRRLLALNIIDSLIVCLDLKRGGEVAVNLRRIYLHLRDLVGHSERADYADNIRVAHGV